MRYKMTDDIIINKSEIIKRCVKRIKEEYDGNAENLKNYTKQDSIILNIQRMCEAAIDLATHIIRIKKIGVPQTSKECFIMLEKEGIIEKELSKKLQGMVGFRNIAVHNYQELDMEILKGIIENNLEDSFDLVRKILKLN